MAGISAREVLITSSFHQSIPMQTPSRPVGLAGARACVRAPRHRYHAVDPHTLFRGEVPISLDPAPIAIHGAKRLRMSSTEYVVNGIIIEESSSATAHTSGTPMTALVLLVDDFEDARDIYSTYLAFKGLRVVCAEDGGQALDMARGERPDVILMDLRMPGLSGTDVMRALREDVSFAGVPIVALTAHALEDEQMIALRAGFDAVISKPCLPDDLFREIADLLAKWRPDLAPL